MKTLLVSMSRTATAYGTHPVRYALLSGRKVLTHGQGAIDEMAEKDGHAMRLSLDSPANLTERLRVRALSRRFVPVLVQRYLTDNGTFTERFRVRSRVNWLRQGEAEEVVGLFRDHYNIPLRHVEAQAGALAGRQPERLGLVRPEATRSAFAFSTSDGIAESGSSENSTGLPM